MYCLRFSQISLNNVHLFISKNFYSIISYSIQQFVVSKTLFYETTRGPCLGKETTFETNFRKKLLTFERRPIHLFSQLILRKV